MKISILTAFVAAALVAQPGEAKSPKGKTAPASKATGLRPNPMLSADDFLGLAPHQQREYIEALWEFSRFAQARDPKFSDFFLDVFGRGSSAWANTPNCDFFQNIVTITPQCEQKFRDFMFQSHMPNANYSNCRTRHEGRTLVMTCDRARAGGGTQAQTFHIPASNGPLLELQGRARSFAQQVRDPERFIHDNHRRATTEAEERIRRTLPTNVETTREQPGDPAPIAGPNATAPAADSRAARAWDQAANQEASMRIPRCVYGGFLIEMNDEDIKVGSQTWKNSCRPVSSIEDLAKSKHHRPQIGDADEFIKNLLGGDAAKGKCPVASERDASSKTVLCNPLLFGIRASKAVICVARGANASKDCADAAQSERSKNEEEWSKNLKAAIELNKVPFDDYARAIYYYCGPLWKDGKESEDAGSYRHQGLVGGRVNQADFVKSCKNLLDQVTALREQLGSEFVEKVLEGASEQRAAPASQPGGQR